MATIPGTLNTNLTDEQVLEAFDNALTHTPSDSTPKEDGSGSAGEAETFARSDHEHPHDTTKQDTLAFEGTYNASTNKVATMSAVKDGKLTGYAQASGDVAANDKIIEAIGKVEKKADDNKYNILLDFKRNNINLSTVNGGVNSGGAGFIIDTTAIDMPAGKYYFCWKNTSTTVSSVVNCYTADNTRVVNENKANNAVEERLITVPQDCAKFSIYCTGINTITDFMIVPEAAFTTGMSYHNPTPSIAQLYQMILALQ